MKRLDLAAGIAAFMLLGACTPKIPDDTVGGGAGAAGISPTAVEFKWEPLKTAESYTLFSTNQGNQAVQSTNFTETIVSSLTPLTDYTYSVRGIRGSGQRLSDPLDTWTFRTWKNFSAVTFASNLQYDGSTRIEWDYRPWEDGLKASFDAMAGSDLVCTLTPVTGGTNPALVNFDALPVGTVTLTLQTLLFDQQMEIRPGQIDARLTYAARCRARYADKTESISANQFLIAPAQSVVNCPTSAVVGTSYTCSPNIRAATLLQLPVGNPVITMHGTNTCTFATPTVGYEIIGTPGAPFSNRSCVLAYTYSLPDINYVSPVISTTVNVTAPDDFTLFPSFAVRALSGAVSYQHLISKISGIPAGRARIKGDVISDFGYGSSFFAGSSDPFPELDPTNINTFSTSFFYGFPVAKLESGVRPNGYSLDAIRPNWASSAPSEGFLRGNLVVPNAMITNNNFKTLSGRTADVSLYTFLTNTYTFDSGNNFSTVPLAYYMRTTVDFSGGGNTWNGNTVERASVVIKPPTSQAIESYVPSSGVGSQTDLYLHADPTLDAPEGLVSVSSNNFDYYTSNCQIDPADPANHATDPANLYPIHADCAGKPRRITCNGDLIVRGPLMLVDADFITGPEGCRVYATGTVFIQGLVSSRSTLALNTPLQIASSRAIVVGYSQGSLGVNGGVRTSSGNGVIDQVFASGTRNPFLTSQNDNAGAAAAALNAIARDANIVNLKLGDASNGYARGAYPLSYVALSAPYVFSNYTGMFTGSLIAEVALFSQLNFTADPRLKTVPMFPMLKGSDVPLKVTR